MFKYGRLKPLYRDTISVKHKERVEKYGEVFTPDNIVKDMIDMIPESETIERTYLEPSCGDGNFLVEILDRKLKLCKSFHDVLVAISSIYGIDIQADNVLEARRRMLGVVHSWFKSESMLLEQEDKINWILYKNIILGNMTDDKMIKLDNEGYLLDFTSDSRDILKNCEDSTFIIASDAGRFDTFNLLGGDKSSYRQADIYDWCKVNNHEVTSEYCAEVIRYFNDVAFRPLGVYNWVVTNEELSYTEEPIFDDKADNSAISNHQVHTINNDFISSLNFG